MLKGSRGSFGNSLRHWRNANYYKALSFCFSLSTAFNLVNILSSDGIVLEIFEATREILPCTSYQFSRTHAIFTGPAITVECIMVGFPAQFIDTSQSAP